MCCCSLNAMHYGEPNSRAGWRESPLPQRLAREGMQFFATFEPQMQKIILQLQLASPGYHAS